jgi:hypothetical protein
LAQGGRLRRRLAWALDCFLPDMDKYFCCLLDVLGFSNKVRGIGLGEMDRLYQLLADKVKKISGAMALVPDVSGHIGVCSRDFESHYFSDTILVWTKALGDPTARLFTELVAELICDGIEIGLPLRGTITFGEMIANKITNTYIGLPIIEAAETEKAQAWIGVSFGRSVATDRAPLHADTILPFRSHYKKPENKQLNSVVVDWPRQWRQGKRPINLRNLVSALNTSPEHSLYYENTLRFIDFSEQNHDWFRQKKYKDGEPMKAG